MKRTPEPIKDRNGFKKCLRLRVHSAHIVFFELPASNTTLIRDDDESVFIRSHLQVTPQQVSTLVERLQEWICDCQASQNSEAETQYGLTVAFYPTKISM